MINAKIFAFFGENALNLVLCTYIAVSQYGDIHN